MGQRSHEKGVSQGVKNGDSCQKSPCALVFQTRKKTQGVLLAAIENISILAVLSTSNRKAQGNRKELMRRSNTENFQSLRSCGFLLYLTLKNIKNNINILGIGAKPQGARKAETLGFVTKE